LYLNHRANFVDLFVQCHHGHRHSLSHTLPQGQDGQLVLPRLMDALDRCTLYLLQPQGLMCNVVLLRSSADEVGFTGSGATCCAFESKCALCVHVYNCSMGSGAEGGAACDEAAPAVVELRAVGRIPRGRQPELKIRTKRST
jgi:hypothetical protein